MNILIKSAKIIDPKSKYNNKICDVFIKDGKIDKIAKKIKSNDKNVQDGSELIYSAENLHISPGWFDLHSNFGEPGYEQKETLETGSNAALKGGFTGVMVMPNNKPSIDNKSMINFIRNATKDNIVDVIPAGNITKDGAGNDIVEMHEMNKAGCKVFTDDKNSIKRNEVMKIAMLYSKDSSSLIMNYPNDKSIANDGVMHEGNISTQLGLRGIPALAEEMMVDRDLNLCEYTKCKLHLSYISTKKSIDKIKKAKAKGLNITADVTIHNLFLTEQAVNNFDTRYKVMPPLRTKKDTSALIKGLNNGTIDVISTDHSPINNEYKKIEFDNAKDGIIGLETAFGLLGKYILPNIGLEKLIEKISINPRKILQLPEVSISEGTSANITLFNPEIEWEFSKNDIKSKSVNTPFIGEKLTGKALAIFNNGQFKES
ncbi:MAG: dihydroorotase [Flavobacteriales bacterium]|nr:dihydroorotase [Flavobacteriales bacterium]|tara:strand:- start:41599 stop:42885 length:1287 start_codon:yes stop_codon:yes gene_type:complete